MTLLLTMTAPDILLRFGEAAPDSRLGDPVSSRSSALFEVGPIDRLLEIVAGAQESLSPILHMPARRFACPIAVATSHRINDLSMSFHEPGSALFHPRKNECCRRYEKKFSRLVGQPEHPIFCRLPEDLVKTRVELGDTPYIISRDFHSQ